MIALNFNSPISHFINRLIDNDGGMRLSHNFINLVAFSPYQQRDHTLGHEYYNREMLPSNFLEDLVNVSKKSFGALILLLHLLVINLRSL